MAFLFPFSIPCNTCWSDCDCVCREENRERSKIQQKAPLHSLIGIALWGVKGWPRKRAHTSVANGNAVLAFLHTNVVRWRGLMNFPIEVYQRFVMLCPSLVWFSRFFPSRRRAGSHVSRIIIKCNGIVKGGSGFPPPQILCLMLLASSEIWNCFEYDSCTFSVGFGISKRREGIVCSGLKGERQSIAM